MVETVTTIQRSVRQIQIQKPWNEVSHDEGNTDARELIGNMLGTQITRLVCHGCFDRFWVLRSQEVVMSITFDPPQLPYTDSPPPRWSPARPCGWPEWSNSAPRTWSRTGMPRGCQERWCAGCRCPPAPRWYSWGQAKSSSPEKRVGRGLNTVQESAFTLTSSHLGRF